MEILVSEYGPADNIMSDINKDVLGTCAMDILDYNIVTPQANGELWVQPLSIRHKVTRSRGKFERVRSTGRSRMHFSLTTALRRFLEML